MNFAGTQSEKTRLVRIGLMVLLLAGMTTATLASFSLPFAPKNFPTCHESQRSLPGPKPADHLCCAVGHQQALLTKVASLAGAPPIFAFALKSPLAIELSEPKRNSVKLGPSPPPHPPLRI